MQKWIILVVICIIILVSVFVILNIEVETEYTPEIEIDEQNLRKTMVSLYFINRETKELEKETRLIDSKELLKDPYLKVVELLAKGPNSEYLEGYIPENSQILDVNFDNYVLTVSFSNEFFEAIKDDEQKNLVISAISKTLTEFKEVSSVNIIIDERTVQNS